MKFHSFLNEPDDKYYRCNDDTDGHAENHGDWCLFSIYTELLAGEQHDSGHNQYEHEHC